MKKYVLGTALFGGLLLFFACSDIGITSPPGAPGPEGPAGKSAYDLWVQQVSDKTIDWDGGTSEADFFKYMKGEPGISAYEMWVEYIKNGDIHDPHYPPDVEMWWPADKNSEPNFYEFLSGSDGATPFINDDGFWQIGDTVTEYLAAGQPGADGAPGDTPFINDDGFWQIGDEVTQYLAAGQPGEQGEQGEPGDTPFINDAGNWQIGDRDTGVPAKGDVVTIDPVTGNWLINGKDTQVSATGAQGDAGPAGKTSYQLWTEDLGRGNIYEPDGTEWPNDVEHADMDHYWYYVRGLNSEGEGVTPGVMERTPLTFVSSVRDTQDETMAIFTFQTDPGATVTMNYQDQTATGTADAQGECVLQFTTSETREYYAVAYAEAAGKLLSYPVQVRVPIRAGSYDLAIDWDQAIWCEPGHPGEYIEVDNSDGSFGHIDSPAATPNSPFIWFVRANPAFIVVPFTTENIAYIKINMLSGMGQFYTNIVTAAPWGNYTYEQGVIVLSTTQWVSGAVGNDRYEVVAYTNQDRPVLTLTFTATNR